MKNEVRRRLTSLLIAAAATAMVVIDKVHGLPGWVAWLIIGLALTWTVALVCFVLVPRHREIRGLMRQDRPGSAE